MSSYFLFSKQRYKGGANLLHFFIRHVGFWFCKVCVGRERRIWSVWSHCSVLAQVPCLHGPAGIPHYSLLISVQSELS